MHDAVLVPGGNPDDVLGQSSLNDILAEVDKSNAVIGGICAGVLVMADAGILEGTPISILPSSSPASCSFSRG
jgi:putative intracellular protease/amidase